MPRTRHTNGHEVPYPHPGGCVECRAEGVCNFCGKEKVRSSSCTNGRCATCHINICTDGGATAPGHGFGRQGGG